MKNLRLLAAALLCTATLALIACNSTPHVIDGKIRVTAIESSVQKISEH